MTNRSSNVKRVSSYERERERLDDGGRWGEYCETDRSKMLTKVRF